MVPPGIEPGTQGFSVLCSTNWAMAPHGAHVSFASAKIGSFSETTKFLPPFLVYFAVFPTLFILYSGFCGEIAEKVTPMGFKPMTFRTGIWRSIQLSYGAFMQCKNTLFRWRGQILHPFIAQRLWKGNNWSYSLFLAPSACSLLLSPSWERRTDFFSLQSRFFYISHFFQKTRDFF